MKRPGLDDLELFLAVTDAGGLQGAAAASGVSAPTLSRRMGALETALGRRLFRRGRHGYALTTDGRALLAEAEALRPLRQRLAGFGQNAVPRVRITAGSFTMRYLARNLDRVWKTGDGWMPEFLSSNATLDIARREADIGIRNRRPEQSWLAGRRTATIRYAEFGRDASVTGYIAMAEGASSTPASRWVRAAHGERIVTTYTDGFIGVELARIGVGRMILPLFAGASEPGLVRLSDPIDEIAHEEWLVCHHEARHDPPVRRALDALAALLTRERTLEG